MPFLSPYGVDRPAGAAGLLVEDYFDVRLVDPYSPTSYGFGGDGQLVQPPAAKPRDGAAPGYKVTGLPRAGEVHGHLSPVGRGIHP